jgi:hypothetical protein
MLYLSFFFSSFKFSLVICIPLDIKAERKNVIALKTYANLIPKSLQISRPITGATTLASSLNTVKIEICLSM